MKRQTALALAAVFSLSVAGTALAAPANPFVDVPAKHWSYDSVNKLAQAGVISGYGDGTYKGDKTLTRYEMATIVAKAMANADKADAETLKTIEALKAEYGSELANLGVRVDNLEKNASKVKFTGEVRERYEYADDVDNAFLTRVRLKMEAKIADNVTFKGRIASESEWGNSNGSSNTTKLEQAYITGEVAGLEYSFGRQPIWLGQGLVADTSANNDGIVITGGKDVKVTAGAFKKSDYNFYLANIDAKLSDKLNLTGSYLKDKDSEWYKTTSGGLNYTGIANIGISGEYGKNDAESIGAKGWMAKVAYKGAEKTKVNSFGLWVGYRNADAGFDPGTLTTLDSGDTAAAADMALDAYGIADNIKGLEYGFNYTLFRNGVLTVQYNDLETKDTKIDKKNLIAQLEYFF
ncbi:S-layer homology domain-containing protein [Sporomusa aerivorans]|uniref:S-layer homology domain-containing protein n=1 Tax=Sporomusa aerivorans TaxID=204936 RepID=UPI00352B504E